MLFLVATGIERREPTRHFPSGFHRAGSLAFVVAASALIVLGSYLAYEAFWTLISAEHPTIGSFRLWGHEVWMGWAMIAALADSGVPPVILGRMKKSVGKDLADKVLYADADMMAADWKTAGAGTLGILGIWFGLWWADAVAAGLISLSILRDGLRNARIAVAELMDGAPRQLESPQLSQTGERIRQRLEARNPGCTARLRQTGRYIRAVVVPAELQSSDALKQTLADEDAWRLIEVSRHADADERENARA